MTEGPVEAKKSALPIRSIDSIHLSIKNSVGLMIKHRFNHSRVTKVSDGSTRTYQRTIHTLSDAIIRIFEEIIQKMIQLSKSDKKQTLGIGTFITAAKLVPGISTVATAHKVWNEQVDKSVEEARKLAESYNPSPTEHSNLNQYMADNGFFIRPTALRALGKARLPCKWRLGGGPLLAIAFSVFCSAVAEAILDGVGQQFDDSKSSKLESVAPRHISKAIESFGAIKSAIGNAVVIGTPLVRRPQIGRKAKRARRSKKADSYPSPSPPLSPSSYPSPPSSPPLSEGEESPPLKRPRKSSA